MIKCCECDKKAKWELSTQFSGNHHFCKKHARLMPGFKKNDPSYSFWYKIQRKKDEDA